MLQKAMISEIDIELMTLNQAIRDHFAWANKLIEFSLFDDRMDISLPTPNPTRFALLVTGFVCNLRHPKKIPRHYWPLKPPMK